MRILLALFILSPTALFATTFAVDTPLEDAHKEAVAQTLFGKILCEVCSGPAINSSGAEFATSMRGFIREELRSGVTETELRARITRTYGEHIWLKPPLAPHTYALWFAPFALLGALAIMLIFRHNKR